MVHGSGPEINHWLGHLNIQAIFSDGLRVTDGQTMEIVSMVLVRRVNKTLASLINRAGATVVGLFDMDDRLITGIPNPKAADLQFVGEVEQVNPAVLQPLIDSGHILVVTSVMADMFEQPYNINVDTVGGELVAALEAKKLILLTDVAGIMEDKNNPKSLVKEIDINGVRKVMLPF